MGGAVGGMEGWALRAARLISLVLLLQVRESMTGAELADELEVSQRTVSRDVLALSESGVPIYSERGKTGGYRLLGGYRVRLTGLHRAEAEALFLAGLPGPAGEMGLAEAVSTARLKVSAALAPVFRDAPQRVDQRFHLDAPRWFREEPAPPLLPELARAVWQDRRVHARYRRGGREVNRELEPYGLVLKAGVWYLVAVSGGGYRMFRVDRFTEVHVRAESFVRAAEFDLAAFWRGQAAEFARSLLVEEVEVRLSQEGLRVLPAVGDPSAVADALSDAGRPDGQGRVTVSLPVESLEVAYHQLLRLGPEAEVLAPEALRRQLADAVTRWAEVYR